MSLPHTINHLLKHPCCCSCAFPPNCDRCSHMLLLGKHFQRTETELFARSNVWLRGVNLLSKPQISHSKSVVTVWHALSTYEFWNDAHDMSRPVSWLSLDLAIDQIFCAITVRACFCLQKRYWTTPLSWHRDKYLIFSSSSSIRISSEVCCWSLLQRRHKQL